MEREPTLGFANKNHVSECTSATHHGVFPLNSFYVIHIDIVL